VTNYFWPAGHFTKTWQLAGHFQVLAVSWMWK